jgi:hypothetical protein
MEHIARTSIVAAFAIAAISTACANGVTAAKHVAPISRNCASAVVESQRDLELLAGCTRIRGDLRIERSSLESLAGLENLHTVTGTLEVAGNARLESLSGLENLRSVEALIVSDNPSLESLDALRGLERAREIRIQRSPGLETLDGFEGIRELASLTLVKTGVFSVSGFSKLVSVDELSVTSNPRLISLAGFAGLEAATRVRVSGNGRLAAHRFLPRLEVVSGSVVIDRNTCITPGEVNALLERLDGRRSGLLAVR